MFLISLFLGLINSLNPLAGVYGIIKIIEFSFLAYYISFSFKSLSKKIIFSLLSISIFFESLLSIFQYLNNSSLGGFFYFLGERTYNAQTPGIANATINGQLFLRPYATFSHPNVLAAYLLITVLYLLMLNTKIKTAIFIIFISAISLVLSLSRGPIFLSFIYLIIFFTFLIFEKFKNGKLKTAIFVFLFSIIVISGIFILFKNTEIFQRFLSLNLTDESVVQRKELLTQAINMFIKNPVFGVGVNNFYNNLNFSFPAQTLLIQPVHNILFLILSETGIVGFVFFILVFFKSFLDILKKQGLQKIYLLLILFAIFFLGFFDHYFLTIQQGQLLLSLFLGTAFSYKKT